MSILMLIFTFCRIIFLIVNRAHFQTISLIDFLAGFWFDLIATCLLFYPLIAIELLPNKKRTQKWYIILVKLFTILPFVLGIFINLVDIEYFQHSANRSNYSLLTMLGFGNDLKQQIPSFFRDYWYILLLFIVFAGSAFYFLKKIKKRNLNDSAVHTIPKQIITYVLMIGLFIFIGRGGFVSKPIRATEAAKFTNSENIQLILNSAFTMINSWGSPGLEEKKYFSSSELDQLYSPIHYYPNKSELNKQNICIILLESFSPEYIGKMNGSGISYSPFFDQLIDSSLFFPNCFANGKKSLDAVPSVLASIPKLMEDEYLLSGYTINHINALPEILTTQGYNTSFYHGASNGSMNFDSFCDLAGFENYYGRTEYNNEDNYDGTWGIFDEPFLQWTIEQMSTKKEPFFSTIFTISSHPPYAIPDQYKDKFNVGPTEMHNAISYTDFALQQFFKTARKQEWFKNTLFVITADHTPASKNRNYASDIGQMNIPLLFYHPTDTSLKGINNQIVGQIDIMPTLLEYIKYDNDFFAFGHSIFNEHSNYTASQIGGKYLFFGEFNDQKYLLVFQNDEVLGLYRLEDVEQKNNLVSSLKETSNELSKQLKAMIQSYNYRMIHNQLYINE